jgi:predicted membrane-bound mannosyltransferase
MKKLETIKFSLSGNTPAPDGSVPLGLPALLIGIVGALLRIRFYFSFAASSLTRDEAALALNFMDTGFFELLKPLRFDQAAPIGFLLVEKLVMAVLGPSELSLRLFSLVTSILIIPLFYLLVRDFLSPVGVLVGLAIIALSEPLIYWGALFKQYSFDVLIALVLLNLGRWAIRKRPGYCSV